MLASSSENSINLLKSSKDKEDARIVKEANDLSGILLVGYTAEGHSYNAGDEGSYSENTSDIFISRVRSRFPGGGLLLGSVNRQTGVQTAPMHEMGGVNCSA
jgi:hypothetical protein